MVARVHYASSAFALFVGGWILSVSTISWCGKLAIVTDIHMMGMSMTLLLVRPQVARSVLSS